MENESLKSSLDALATHAEALVKQNKELRQQAEEREKMMRSVVVGVRREVSEAKRSHVVSWGPTRLLHWVRVADSVSDRRGRQSRGRT